MKIYNSKFLKDCSFSISQIEILKDYFGDTLDTILKDFSHPNRYEVLETGHLILGENVILKIINFHKNNTPHLDFLQ